MVPWDAVPDEYKMDPDQLEDFSSSLRSRGGVGWIAQKTGDMSAGDWHDPNIICTNLGLLPSPTALGNTRWILDEHALEVMDEIRIRRLMPQEVLEEMGFTGQHALDTGDTQGMKNGTYADSMGYQWAGNAVPIHLSHAMAIVPRMPVVCASAPFSRPALTQVHRETL